MKTNFLEYKNIDNKTNILKSNLLLITIIYIMKIRLALFTLSVIGLLSYVYSYYLMNFISNFISMKVQSFILVFCTIIVFLDNFSLVYDLNSIKTIDENENIKIIGNQAIEIQKNKMIIYKLTKLNEQQIIKPHNKKFLDRNFNRSF